MTRYAYDYANEELLRLYAYALSRISSDGSGITMSYVDVSPEHEEVYYLHGVLLSRLEGQQRPFSRFDVVRLKDQQVSKVVSLNRIREMPGYIQPNEVLTIRRVYYLGDKKWALDFKDMNDYVFRAEHFELENKTEFIGADP